MGTDGIDHTAIPRINVNPVGVLRIHSFVSLFIFASAVAFPLLSLILFLIWGVLVYTAVFFILFPGELKRTASKITFLRFLLAGGAAVTGLTLFAGRPWIPVIFFAAAALTDFFDGFAARRSMPSAGGGFLDAETDAIFLSILGIYLYGKGFAGSSVLLCGALRYLFIFPFERLKGNPEFPRPFSVYAKAACGTAAGLLIAAAAPVWSNPIIFWLPALVLLSASFIWELKLRLKFAQIRDRRGRNGRNKLRKGDVFRLAAGILSVLILSAVLGAFRWFPRYNWPALLFPTLETVLVVTAVVLFGKKKRGSGALLIPLAAVTGFLAVYSGVEAFMQHTFLQPFIPRADIAYFSPLIEMVLHRNISGFLLLCFVVLLCGTAVAAVFILLRRIRAAASRYPKAAALGAVLLFAAALLTAGDNPLYARVIRQVRAPAKETILPEPPVMSRAGEEIAVEADETGKERVHAGEMRQYRLPGIQDADIIVLVVESYGNTIFTNPEHYGRMADRYEELEESLTDAGITAVSGLMRSPIAGGRSWLADATLLAGIPLDNQAKFDALLETRPYTLLHFLHEAEYHTIFAAPGTSYLLDDWMGVFPFKEFYIQGDFGYNGPFLSFGAMPDQFLLESVHRIIDGYGKEKPLFIEVLLSTSHTPFDVVPAYVPDWSLLGDGSIYEDLESQFYDNGWLGGSEYPEGFTDSISYVLRSIRDFSGLYLSDDDLLFVFGDHQPRYPVLEQGAGWAVPIHILAKNEDLLEVWKRIGYVPGLVPDQNGITLGMEEFFPVLRDVAVSGTPDIPNPVPNGVQEQ